MMYQAKPTRYDEMPYKRCGRSGIKLPAISLGLWHNFGGVDVFENGRAMLIMRLTMALLTLIWLTTMVLHTVQLKRILDEF